MPSEVSMHGDRWSMLIIVLTSLRIYGYRSCMFGAVYPEYAQFADFQVAPASAIMSRYAPAHENGLWYVDTCQYVSRLTSEILSLR